MNFILRSLQDSRSLDSKMRKSLVKILYREPLLVPCYNYARLKMFQNCGNVSVIFYRGTNEPTTNGNDLG